MAEAAQVASLIDPAKLATLGKRGANPAGRSRQGPVNAHPETPN